MRTLILFTLATLLLTPGVYDRHKRGKPINFLPFCALCFCLLCLLVSIVTAVKTQVNMEKEAQIVLEQREELVDRIDPEMDDEEWESLLVEIEAFNHNILEVRRNAENPWVDWFTNSDIASIRLIDIPVRESEELGA